MRILNCSPRFIAFWAVLVSLKAFSQCTDSIVPVITSESVITSSTGVYPQPTAFVTDDTEVTLTAHTTVQFSQTENLITPDIGENLCNYADASAFITFAMPTTYRYWTADEGGQFEIFENGTAHFTCTFTNTTNPNGKLAADVWLEGGYNWTDWQTAPVPNGSPVPHGYKHDCGGVGANHEDWKYYYVSGNSTMTGLGDYVDTYLSLSHAPVNYFFGYQYGSGANNYSPEFGSGGWVIANGNFIDHSTNFTLSGLTSTSDFMFKQEYSHYDAIIETVYTATDACGNTSTLTQEVQINENPGPVLSNMPVAGTEMELCDFINWQPNWVSFCGGEIASTIDASMTEVISGNPTTVTVTCTASDNCGGTSTYYFEVLVWSNGTCGSANCAGDFNADGMVTSNDVNQFMGGFQTSNAQFDINDDAQVNMLDFILVLENFGNLCGN